MLIYFLTVYEALRHKLAFGIYIFNLLRSNILALSQLKYIFLPVTKLKLSFICLTMSVNVVKTEPGK